VDLRRRAAAEALGSAFLLATVIGSGIMGERLSGGSVALALLANTLATGTGLAALVLTFGPVSGAHFNPAVSLVETIRGRLSRGALPVYVVAQIGGAFVGVAVAHAMFSEPWLAASRRERSSLGELVGEFVATFGLLSVVVGCRAREAPFAIGAYIASAYWFTSSTSFANPAVTLARAASDTFAGIRPQDVPGFIGAQLGGALVGAYLFQWLRRDEWRP
jgi:glycerol uptake facilitator-like aquaporin